MSSLEVPAMSASPTPMAGELSAQALYEKCGFFLVGKRRSYYSNPVEDALTMSAQLKGSA